VEIKNFEETRVSCLKPNTKFFDLKQNQNQFLECQFKMPKGGWLMLTSLKILVANTQYKVALATRWLELVLNI